MDRKRKQDYILLATDLDETLLNAERKIGQKTLAAIKEAQSRNKKIVLATGRPYFSTLQTQKEAGVYQKPGEYTISLNGAVIVENATGKPVFTAGIDFETVKTLFERAKQYPVGIHIYTDETTYGFHIDRDELDYLDGRQEIVSMDSADISFLQNKTLIKMLYVNTDQDLLKRIARDLEPVTKGLEVSYSSNRYLEFNRKGINKGTGLIKLCELLEIPVSATIGVGDNFNDLALIQTAGLGVGVANANPGIKAFCDVITEADCEHDAVAEVIERYL